MHPLAVQIDYADWLELERLLGLQSIDSAKSNGGPPHLSPPSSSPAPMKNLNRFAGTLTLREDPLAFQRRVRDDWA